MAEMKSAMEREDMLRRFALSKQKAQSLLAQTERLAKTALSSSDNTISFLNLTARLHHFDAYNLLLIWDRFPSASYVAAFNDWKKQLPETAQVLREEEKGNGIILLCPITEFKESKYCLVWYSVSAFDISQTTVPAAPPSFDPAYVMDRDHEVFLLGAVQQTLSTQYGRSVIVQPPSQLMLQTGLPGHITEQVVILRDDISLREQLQWLVDAMVQLSVQEMDLTPDSLLLLKTCINYCLFRIWSLDSYALPPSNTQLKSAAGRELNLLHTIRDATRYLNNLVSSCYIIKRQTDDDTDDIELEDLMHFS